jgi:hypothetical protein
MTVTVEELRRVRTGLRRIDHVEFAKLYAAGCGTVDRGYTARAFADFGTDPLGYVADRCDNLARALLGAANRLAP